MSCDGVERWPETYPRVPAKYPEIEYWVTHEKAVLLLQPGMYEGVLALPRRETFKLSNGDVVQVYNPKKKRTLINVMPRDIEALRQRGWRDYRTHMLLPEEYSANPA